MIDRIVIDNFKSIKHADVTLQKVNLLIGPNNSGKSNFLKSVVAVKNSINPNLLSFIVSNNNLDKVQTNFQVYFDKSTVSSWPDTTSYFNESVVEESNRLKTRAKAVDFLFGILANSLIYKPDVNKLHKPFRMYQLDERISGDAANVTSFLQNCLNKYRNVFDQISNELKEVVPLFKEIIIDTANNDHKNSGTVPEVKVGIRDTAGREVWLDDLSDGALYFLALLCIIHQPNPPKVLLLEEPETGIHPRRIKEVIDLIKKLSDEKDIQVIMTTHSPMVVDLFEDEPECIYVFEMKDGFTEIKNLKEDIIEPTNKELKEKGIDADKDYGLSLGDQWVYGFLGGVPA